ncbi:unnamed protein product [Arabidopsis thaliana]|uniref:F-box domain-containing protein n=1 Tax=Arabidopsis thaliana TaxID=3702 RepID=A0A5S9WFE6_ARATH|nr:unnamed protein product [Arabidopsis thaliana]
MASLSLVLRYVVFLSFFILQKPKETFSSRLQRSHAKVAQIGADDYPSSGRNTPVHDLGFPDFPSFQEAVAPPPPPPDLPLLAPPLPDVPLLPPPAFPDFEKPRLPVPVWPSLPEYPPFPFVDQSAPYQGFAPRFDESANWMPSTPSIPQVFPCLRFKSNLVRVEFWVSSGTAIKGKDRFCNRPSKLDPNPVDLKTVRLPSKFRLKKLLCRVESSEVCFGDGNEKDTNPSEIDLDSLPFDLKMVILTRLSAKSLTNFKRVSKMWSSIIGSQRFIDSFFTMSSKQSRCPKFPVNTRFVGYDPIDDQHKALSVSVPSRKRNLEHKVLTLGGGGQGWRHIEVTNAPFCPVTVGVSIDGFVYYGAYSPTPPMNPVLVCFDVRSEKISFIKAPKDVLQWGFDLWILEDVERHEWSKQTCVFPSSAVWDYVGDIQMSFPGTNKAGIGDDEEFRRCSGFVDEGECHVRIAPQHVESIARFKDPIMSRILM